MSAGPGTDVVLTVALFFAWSFTCFWLGRELGAVTRPRRDRGEERPVLFWLAVAIVGLVLTLLWGEGWIFGVLAVFVTTTPIIVAYSALLFDVGRRP